jgi:hypothetical protein
MNYKVKLRALGYSGNVATGQIMGLQDQNQDHGKVSGL